MTEDIMEVQTPPAAEPVQTSSGKKKWLFIIAAAVLVISLAGGYFAYSMLTPKKDGGHPEKAAPAEPANVELVAMDPFVMNLSEQNRFLKMAIQFELADKSYQPLVADRIPQLRDAIIILVSSKSFDSVMRPEGKFQLKDEILLRANQAIGKDIFKNLYFTEFVMQ